MGIESQKSRSAGKLQDPVVSMAKIKKIVVSHFRKAVNPLARNQTKIRITALESQ